MAVLDAPLDALDSFLDDLGITSGHEYFKREENNLIDGLQGMSAEKVSGAYRSSIREVLYEDGLPEEPMFRSLYAYHLARMALQPKKDSE